MNSAGAPTSHRSILRLAWPIMLANIAVPLLGLADTAVIGHTGTVTDLGAIALGAIIFGFVYWTFGFLRMGTTGFVAQADGADDEAEIRAALGRALLLALIIGLALILTQQLIAWGALALLGASTDVEAVARDYLLIRIWGAPAVLATYACLGVLIGLGRNRALLVIQLFLNGLNIVLDILFAGVFGWGVAGIALGTAIAEWCSLALALFVVLRILRQRAGSSAPFWSWPTIIDLSAMRRTLTANTDIMLRTLFLLVSFAWFIDQGARFGDVTLAANHILLQFISFAAFFLDGYAHAAESLIGSAVGARNRQRFDATVKASTQLAAATAAALAVLLALGGGPLIQAMTDLEAVREEAGRYLPYAFLYVAASFAAFQLDGIFIGATRTRDMRNAAFLSTAGFLLLSWPLATHHGNAGLWLAFIGYLLLRAVTLLACVPALRSAAFPTAERSTN